jgi:UDP-N-acetylmuramate--alanine ligase
VSFGLDNEKADYRVINPELKENGSRFEVLYQGNSLGHFELKIPGTHNIYNALAALSCSHALGLDLKATRTALAGYQGVKRRFQLVGNLGSIAVVDDYAHHPSEIQATLKTARLQKRPLTIVFQPHRYSRTQAFLHEFADSFGLADRIILTDIYAASEKPEDFQVDIQDLVEATHKAHPSKEVLYFSTLPEVKTYLLNHLKQKEMILTVGAGTITELAYDLVGKLPPKSPDPTGKSNEQKIVYAPVRRTHQERKVV